MYITFTFINTASGKCLHTNVEGRECVLYLVVCSSVPNALYQHGSSVSSPTLYGTIIHTGEIINRGKMTTLVVVHVYSILLLLPPMDPIASKCTSYIA